MTTKDHSLATDARHINGEILLGRIDDPADLPDEAVISAITLAELSVGPHVAHTDEERAARQAHLQEAESDFDVLVFDAESARAFGSVAASLRASARKPAAPATPNRRNARPPVTPPTGTASGMPTRFSTATSSASRGSNAVPSCSSSTRRLRSNAPANASTLACPVPAINSSCVATRTSSAKSAGRISPAV